MHDGFEMLGRVEVEALFNSEARAHGRREHSKTSRRADEGEFLDRHRDGLRLRTFGKADVDPVVFHRRIEKLFDDWLQSMNLVDEENVTSSKIRECSDEIARLLERGSRSRADVDAHLACDQL